MSELDDVRWIPENWNILSSRISQVLLAHWKKSHRLVTAAMAPKDAAVFSYVDSLLTRVLWLQHTAAHAALQSHQANLCDILSKSFEHLKWLQVVTGRRPAEDAARQYVNRLVAKALLKSPGSQEHGNKMTQMIYEILIYRTNSICTLNTTDLVYLNWDCDCGQALTQKAIEGIEW